MTGTNIRSPSVGCVHLNPASTLQSAVQPSPSTVLPSSHASPTTMPSPHVDAQAPVALVQVGSVWQSAEHLSNGVMLPSSQLSAPSTMRSPHVVCEQALGAPLHFQPSSTLH